jgi:hypothetical protein
VQTAVDTKNHLIVAHQVTNVGPSVVGYATVATDRSRMTKLAFVL